MRKTLDIIDIKAAVRMGAIKLAHTQDGNVLCTDTKTGEAVLLIVEKEAEPNE